MYCPYCRENIPTQSAFCPKCGADLSRERMGAEGGGRQAPKPSRQPATPAPGPQPMPGPQSTPGPRPAPGPQPPAPAPKPAGTGKKVAIVLGIVTAVLAVALVAAFLIVPNILKPKDVRGYVSGRTYVNRFFELQHELPDTFAFASKSELDSLFTASVDIARELDIKVDEKKAEKQVIFDAMEYNPINGDIVFVAVSPLSIPSSIDDDELMDTLSDGILQSGEAFKATDVKQEKQRLSIGESEYPASLITMKIHDTKVEMFAALIRKDDHVAVLAARSITAGRPKELLEGFTNDLENAPEPPKASESDDDADASTTEYSHGTTSSTTYTSECLGFALKLPNDFIFEDVSAVDDQLQKTMEELSGDSGLLNSSSANAFIPEIHAELAASNKKTGEIALGLSFTVPKSYSDTYDGTQIATNFIDQIPEDTLRKSMEAAGASNVKIEHRTCKIGDKDVPYLFETYQIAGISFSQGQIALAHDNYVTLLQLVTFDSTPSRFEEIAKGITML